MEPIFMVNGIFPAYWTGQPGFSLELIQSKFAYILDASGWKLYKRNGVSTAVIKVDFVSGLASLEQKINFQARKLPLELIRKVTAWFKAVFLNYRSEAVGYLYYQPSTGEWQFVPPTQTATGASANYEEAPKLEGWQVVGTIHSHGSMSAFHSGTDDADEKNFDGVHITVGRCDGVPEYSCSLVVQGKREVVDPSVLIDGMAPMDAVPAEWIAAMKLAKPTVPIGFQAELDKVYSAYYGGKTSERQYKLSLATLEKAIADEELEQRRLVAISNPVGGVEGYGYGGQDWKNEESFFSSYRHQDKKKKKGGRYDK